MLVGCLKAVDYCAACCTVHDRPSVCQHTQPIARDGRKVYTWSLQGSLSQWALHWARAQGPRIFFLFEGPPTGCGKIFFKLII